MNRRTIRLKFADWTPDLPDFERQEGNDRLVDSLAGNLVVRGATVAKNVFPQKNSYKPVASPVVYSNALDAKAIGSYGVKDDSGNASVFAATRSKLYQMVGSATFEDKSQSGGYVTADGEHVEFAKWGNLIISTNFNDNPQSFTLGTSSLFADLPGSPPRARHIAVARDFVFLGNVVDSVDGTVPQRLWWSAFNAPDDWVPSASTQSDYQSLEDEGGWIQRLIGGERLIIFKQTSVWIATYIGSPLVWRFDKVEENRGTPAPRSVVKVGNRISFLSDDGFFMFDGIRTYPIGNGKVDSTFLADLNKDYWINITVTLDIANKLILWAYPSNNSTGGNSDKILVYNWADDKWSLIETTVQMVGDFMTEGYTLEGLDAVNTSLDALPLSLDSTSWMGGNVQLSAFGTDNKLYTFSGEAMAAVIETEERGFAIPRRALISSIWPLVEGSSAVVTAQIGVRNTQQENTSWGSAISVNSIGRCPARSDAQFHRFRVNIDSGFNHAQGVLVEVQPSGGR